MPFGKWVRVVGNLLPGLLPGAKRARALSLAVVLLCGLGASAQQALAQNPAKAGDVRVVLQPSDVARMKGTQEVKTTAEKGMPVLYQDVLETGQGGRMRAVLADGSILAVGSQGRLKVVENNAKTQQSTFQLEYGKVRAQVVKQTQPGAHFEVKTNTAVAGVLGTDFIVDALSPILTMVFCLEGRVSVRNTDPNIPDTVIITAGEVTIVQQGVAPTAPRAATTAELNRALDTVGGDAPQAIADLGTGFATVGQDMLLNGADSFGGSSAITTYQWQLNRAQDNGSVYNQTVVASSVKADTTTWQPGNYKGTLTVTNGSNQTGSTNFGFYVLPADISTANPQVVIEQLKYAYETLQPTEFMKLFDPVKYLGYTALRDSIESSFRSISQIRVFVRTASGQIYPEIKEAIYQVDFEIQFSLKNDPQKLYTTREQATLRMDSGSGWLITDVPQGSLGSAGLFGVPGVNSPGQVNNPGTEETTGTEGLKITPTEGGEGVRVISGGNSRTFVIQNPTKSTVTITFALPPGLTLTGPGVSGNTVTVPAGTTVSVVFVSAPGQPEGTVTVSSTVSVGTSTSPGPSVPVTIFNALISFPSGGASPANPVPVVLGGFGGKATVQLASALGAGEVVSLSAAGGSVNTAFSPTSVPLTANGSLSTLTMIPLPSALPGADQVIVMGTVEDKPVTAPLFINRVVPFVLTRTGTDPVRMNVTTTAQVTFNVDFNPAFSGPVQITAPPSAAGISFSPATLNVTNPGPISFTVTAGTDPTVQPVPFAFTGSAGTGGANYSQSATASVMVLQPIEFTLTGGSIAISPAQSGQVAAQVGFVSGIPQTVNVAVVPGTVNANLISVTGGGGVPNASGSIPFTITVAPNAPPGTTTFNVIGTANDTSHQATVTVTIRGDFSFVAAARVNVLQNVSTPVSLGILPIDGFNAPVALTFSSNNPGIGVTGPATITVGQSVSMNVTAAPDASGPAAITVLGVSGTASHSVSITIVVGTFILTSTAVQPLPLFLGGTASLPVTVTGATGFTGDVTLTSSATGGVTLSTVTPVVGGNGTRTFTLGTTPQAVAGTAQLTITGTSNGITNTLQITVQLTAPFTLATTAVQPVPLFLGLTAPLAVTVTGAPGFTSDVALAATPLGGVVATTVTPVVGGTGNRTFTLGTSAGSTPGTVTVTVQGTSGTFTAFLQIAVQLTQGFTLTADPANLFLGNAGPMVVHLKRVANFNANVAVSIGTLPSSIAGVDVPSVVAAVGKDDLTFNLTAGSDTVLSGVTASIPINGVPVLDPASSGLSAGGTASVSGSATLQAPFSFATPAGTNYGAVRLGNTGALPLQINYLGTPAFNGAVQITAVPFGGVLPVPPPAEINATTTINVAIQVTVNGPFGVTVTAKAGTFTLVAVLSGAAPAPPPPPPPPPAVSFTLTVTPSTVQQVNANIPVTVQVKVNPANPNSTAVVTVSVPDGSQMQYDASCGAPPGFLSYTGTPGTPLPTAALTFTVGPPYTAVNFCMSAGQLGVPVTQGPDANTISGTVAGAGTVTPTLHSFQIGVPIVTVSPVASFNVPLNGSVAGNIAVSSPGASGGFNLPLQVYVTGTGTTLVNGRPSGSLPAGVTSSDCGPLTAGKTVLPGNSVTCTISSSTSSVTATGIEVFAVFSGSAVVVPFNICQLDARASNATCGGTVLPGPPTNFTTLVSPNTTQQANANIPVALQMQVFPPSGAYTSTVTVTVPDGAQMQYDPSCGAPAGFVSYTGTAGAPNATKKLTFTVAPPYTPPVSFCMSAGQLGTAVTAGADATAISATDGVTTVPSPHSFQIGMPSVTVAPAPANTFNIPLSGTDTANVTVQFLSGFNPSGGVTLWVTGLTSSLGRSGPILGALPAGISSSDCGPNSVGKTLTTGGTVTCQITNGTTSGSNTPQNLEVFLVFGPGGALATQFQICALGPGVTPGCGVGILGANGLLTQNIADPSAQQFGVVRKGSGLPVLTISPNQVRYSPLLPREGERVVVRARVENHGESDAHDVPVALLVNKQTVATAEVDVAAGSSASVEFEWQAAYQPRLSMAIAVDPEGRIAEGGNLLRIAAVRNFSVEPANAAMTRQGRSLLIIANGDCGGFRFVNAVQSFCGGSSDFDLSPSITASGQLLVQFQSLNGGVIDMGPGPITGSVEAPDGGYQSRTLLQSGHLYAVESNGKYGLMYVGRIQSDVDPRLARLESGSSSAPQVGSGELPSTKSDALGTMLDHAKITVDVQWAYLDNGSRRFLYGFSGGSSSGGATTYRQPRVPSTPPARQ